MELLTQPFEFSSNEGYKNDKFHEIQKTTGHKNLGNKSFLRDSKEAQDKGSFKKVFNKAASEKNIQKISQKLLKAQSKLEQPQSLKRSTNVKFSEKNIFNTQGLSQVLSKVSQNSLSSNKIEEIKKRTVSLSEKSSQTSQNKKGEKKEDSSTEKAVNFISNHQLNSLAPLYPEMLGGKLRGFQDDKSSFHLVNIKGRNIQVSIEDLRNKKDALKMKGDFAHSLLKTLESFEGTRKLNAFETKTSQNFFSDQLLGFSKDPSGGLGSFSNGNMQKSFLEFSSSFLREWESKVHSQIADKAHLILKDNNQGEIRLSLHPEYLGNVRVHLDLKDGQVLARFVVENPQVKQLLESSSSSLQNSLEQTGMNISLSFSHSKQNNEQSHSQQDQRERFISRNIISSLNVDEGSSVENIDIFLSKEVEDSINMIV